MTSMKLGKHNLNEDESKWLSNYIDGLFERSTSEVRDALNKAISQDDVVSVIKSYVKKEEISYEDEEEIDDDEDE